MKIMKVMLPVKNKSEIAEGFHNIENICIYDSDLNAFQWFHSKEISKNNGGLNSGLIENDVTSIISLNISPMVLSMFNRNGIFVYKAQSNDLSKNIQLFKTEKLKIFTLEESQRIMSCSTKSCSSCSSSCN